MGKLIQVSFKSFLKTFMFSNILIVISVLMTFYFEPLSRNLLEAIVLNFFVLIIFSSAIVILKSSLTNYIKLIKSLNDIDTIELIKIRSLVNVFLKNGNVKKEENSLRIIIETKETNHNLLVNYNPDLISYLENSPIKTDIKLSEGYIELINGSPIPA